MGDDEVMCHQLIKLHPLRIPSKTLLLTTRGNKTYMAHKHYTIAANKLNSEVFDN